MGGVARLVFWSAANTLSQRVDKETTKTTFGSDYRAYDGAVYLAISPGIPGCIYGGVHRVRMLNGALGMTADTLKGGIAIGLTAMATNCTV